MLTMVGLIKKNLELQGKLPDKWKEEKEPTGSSDPRVTIAEDGKGLTLAAGTYNSNEGVNALTLTEDTFFELNPTFTVAPDRNFISMKTAAATDGTYKVCIIKGDYLMIMNQTVIPEDRQFGYLTFKNGIITAFSAI